MTVGPMNRELSLVAANRSDRDSESVRVDGMLGEQIGATDTGRVVEGGSHFGRYIK